MRITEVGTAEVGSPLYLAVMETVCGPCLCGHVKISFRTREDGKDFGEKNIKTPVIGHQASGKSGNTHGCCDGKKRSKA